MRNLSRSNACVSFASSFHARAGQVNERAVAGEKKKERNRAREASEVFRPSRLTALTTTSRGPSEARGNLEASDVLSV